MTWFPFMRPPPESPLHGPMLGVTFLKKKNGAKTMFYSNPDQVASADHVLLQPFPIVGVRVGGTASQVRNSRQVCSL